MWNDTDTPLAFLITFRTYGTWLHGDDRGSINRFRNTYGTGYLPSEESWLARNTAKLKSAPVKLDSRGRACVESAIRDCCTIRGWNLFAIHVRTNHAHTVVANSFKSAAAAMGAFKANATREMRQNGLWTFQHSPWVDKGSIRNLWNEEDIASAVEYVLYGQGDDLPKFVG